MTMTLKMASAPHLRLTERSAALSLDVLIALVPLCVFSFVHYGVRPVLLVLTGIVTAVVCELLCCAFMRRKPSVLDGTAAVTGGLVGAMMSPLSPYWLPVIAAAFAILVVKMPFGGAGRNVFNPAAAGLAVVTVCFPGRVFLYPYAGQLQPLPLGDISGVLTAPVPEYAPEQRGWYQPELAERAAGRLSRADRRHGRGCATGMPALFVRPPHGLPPDRAALSSDLCPDRRSVSPRGRQRRDQRDAGDERRSAAVQRRVFGH